MTTKDTEAQRWDELLSAVIGLLTEAARLRWSSVDPAGVERFERADFAEFVSLALAGAAANAGGIEEILAGRSGSWEAGYVRDMLASTVGWEEEYLWEHRTEPLALRVQVDAILTELGIADLYEDSEAEITRLEDAVGVRYDVLCPDGLWACSDPDAAPLTVEEIAAVSPWARPGHRVYREPTPDQDHELERLQVLRDRLEALREAEWAAYGLAFQVSVLAELEREPVKGLRVPVEFKVDDRIWPPATAVTSGEEPLPWGLERLDEAGRWNTPLPGSGIAPKDYPPGADIAQVERAAGRLPHQRIGDWS
jgi:hypothetical protein